jgi:hypothetical protein
MLSVVWHYWISVPLAILAAIAVVATVVSYLRKTQAPKYPGDR